jgi:hypothetical protein
MGVNRWSCCWGCSVDRIDEESRALRVYRKFVPNFVPTSPDLLVRRCTGAGPKPRSRPQLAVRGANFKTGQVV